MKELMAELSPYIMSGLFLLAGWYLRDNARRHQALADAVQGLGGTISRLEQKLEDRADEQDKRLNRFALSQEARLTTVETRCAIEHGEIPDRRATAQRAIHWQERSDIGNAGTKAPE